MSESSATCCGAFLFQRIESLFQEKKFTPPVTKSFLLRPIYVNDEKQKH
jgi:hypothetical protein